MHNGRIKVLYVAGFGRSGSTLIGNILGQIDGFFSVGELRNIWRHGLIENKVCGCGALFRECEMWRAALNTAFGGVDRIDPREMIQLRKRVARKRHIPLMLSPWGRRLLEPHLGEYLGNLESLYRAIQATTGSRVIVDSSKNPFYGYALKMMPSVDLYVVHLVRDPRAVAYSWLRKKRLHPDTEDSAHMRQHTPLKSSLRWMERNLSAEAFWRRSAGRYLMLRYEDFATKPQEVVRQILDLVQERASLLPFVGEREIELGVNHNIWGNPSRFQTGAVEIQPDSEWLSRIKLRDRVLVTSLTFPLLARYGYSGPLCFSPSR